MLRVGEFPYLKIKSGESFLVSCFLGFEISWFIGFSVVCLLVYWMVGFLVPKFQRFKNSFNVFGRY